MAVAGTVNCQACGSAWSKPDGPSFGVVRITSCPNCKPGQLTVTEEPVTPSWAVPPEPKVSAAAALDELLEEVQRDEKDWTFNDKLDMSLRVEEERNRHPRKRKP